MKILWIGGWAIDPQSIEALVSSQYPQHEHRCIHPHENFQNTINSYQADALVGYSLGATLLLTTGLSLIPDAFLIAPFINIKNATHVDNTQLKYLLKWLKKDPANAINDFYKHAQLTLPNTTNSSLPYPLDDLIWGIETLIESQHFLNDNPPPHLLKILKTNPPWTKRPPHQP